MQKRYQYCMSGMFAATDQNYYEINIPSPHTYETEEEAMADGAFGYRFVWQSNIVIVLIFYICRIARKSCNISTLSKN